VVAHPWDGQDLGPGGKTIWLTNAPVEKPLQPLDDDDDRGLIGHCYIKVAKQPWDLSHPPQQSGRAVRVHVALTLLLLVWATAYRLPCEREATAGEDVGW
jgi:hypothetical protein